MPKGIYQHKPNQGYQKGHRSFLTEESCIKLSKTAKENGFGKWMTGKKLSEETKRKISEHHKKNGIGKWMKGRNSRESCKFWKGGITPVNTLIRTSIEYKEWRISVFKRDGYACIFCGVKNGNGMTIKFNADHIKPFALFPDLRFNVENGRTLCVPCHRTTDTFGSRIKTYNL